MLFSHLLLACAQMEWFKTWKLQDISLPVNHLIGFRGWTAFFVLFLVLHLKLEQMTSHNMIPSKIFMLQTCKQLQTSCLIKGLPASNRCSSKVWFVRLADTFQTPKHLKSSIKWLTWLGRSCWLRRFSQWEQKKTC